MSQDKSSSEQALNEAADKEKANDRANETIAPATPAADSTNDSGKRKQSGIAQPVDALRQPAMASAGKSDSKAMKASSAVAGSPDSAAAIPLNSTNLKSNPKPQANTTSGSTSAMDSTKQENPPKPSASRGIWGGIFLGLLLVAVALAAGLWWQQQRFETVAREVGSRLQQSDQMITQARDNATQALSLANAQREVLDQLSRELAVTASELKTLQQAWEAANEGVDQTLLLNDLERLVNMANQELVLFGNVNSAVSILSSVDAMLKSQSAPALKSLQQAVMTDLARLRSVPQVDVASLSTRLDSLIQLTGKAPLLSPSGQVSGASKSSGQGSVVPSGSSQSAVPDTSDAVADPVTPWWQSWGTATAKVSQWTSDASNTLMREFADVMSIRKADDPQALLLSEEQAIQLRANVRAMLLSAQLALMTRQADIWRSELNEVRSILNTRYDTQSLDTKASLGILDELLDAPVAAEVPQISDTLSALASAERALTIPAAQDGLSPSDNSPQQPSQIPGSDDQTGGQDSGTVPSGQAASNGTGAGLNSAGEVTGSSTAGQGD